MSLLIALVGLALIALMLQDAFEAMLLPRRVSRSFRFARLYYQSTWRLWSALARWMRTGKRREMFLSYFGPLSMLFLFGAWAVGLIAGFALLHWALGSPMSPTGEPRGFFDYGYFSGVTFFTLGYGDIAPLGRLGRVLAVVETGIGFGFLAVAISYLPVLYSAFSTREVTISLLDARAGSPPTAGQLLLRLAPQRDRSALGACLVEWERWAAQVLESHLSFPVLSFYRSQHDNQSWLAAMTLILDTTALLLAGVKTSEQDQARLTFAMARHAVVDLCQVFQKPPITPEPDRLPPDRLERLRAALRSAKLDLAEGPAVAAKLAELRGMYEPFLNALSRHFLLPLPPIVSDVAPVDNWQTSAWMRRTSGLGKLALSDPGDDHVD